MTPNDYQKAAIRTECPTSPVLNRMVSEEPLSVRLLHGIMGVCTESGELATLVKKWLFYGQPLDKERVADEVGDVCWYLALISDACGVDLESVLVVNINKLHARFPDRYSDEKADDQNRNRAAESSAMKIGTDLFYGDEQEGD